MTTDRLAQALGQRQLRIEVLRVGSVGGPETGDLGEEERIPARAAVHALGELGRQRTPGHRLDEAGDFARVEAFEPHRVGAR
jgi:hypothetical protein